MGNEIQLLNVFFAPNSYRFVSLAKPMSLRRPQPPQVRIWLWIRFVGFQVPVFWVIQINATYIFSIVIQKVVILKSININLTHMGCELLIIKFV